MEYEDQIINVLLGLDIAKTSTGNDKTIKFIMDFCIDRLLFLTDTNYWNPKDALTIQKPLGTDIGGISCKETHKWIYSDAVSMIQYLSSNS